MIILLAIFFGIQVLFIQPVSHHFLAGINSSSLLLEREKAVRESVVKFGAVPNDNIDDTSAIQQAINTVSEAGGGIIDFPKGIYLVSVHDQSRNRPIIVIHSNITLQGEGSENSIVKLNADQGDYDSIFGADTPSAWLENFSMYDLGIDGNGQGNPIRAEKSLESSGLFRYAIRLFVGNNVKIERNKFINQNNVNTITVNGEDSIRNIVIRDNNFVQIGGGEIDYDHSTIYTQGSNISIVNNTFASRSGAGTKGARTAIEIHGSDQDVTGNIITGYLYGINVTGEGLRDGSTNQLYSNNTIQDAGTGIVVWSSYDLGDGMINQSSPALSNVTIRDNRISINIEKWRGFFDEEPRSGITFEPNRNAPIQSIRIVGNQISFSGYIEAGVESDYFSSGITLWKYRYQYIPVREIYILNNTIEGTPGTGIYFNSVVEQGEISGNQIVNPGQSQYHIDDIYRSAIYLANKVEDLQVNENRMYDERFESTMRYGIVEQTECKENCSAVGNILQTANKSVVPFFSINSPIRSERWFLENNVSF